MPIGIGAAMLIGSAIAGGTAVAGAKISSNAASNARNQQQQATNQALGVQQQMAQPFVQAGQAALGRIQPFQPYQQQFSGAGGSNGFQPPQQPPMQQPQGAPQGAPQGGPAPGSLGAMQGGQMPQPMGAPGAPQGGAMVTVQDDSGATRQVPQAMAQMYVQRGFKVLGGGGSAPAGSRADADDELNLGESRGMLGKC